MPWHLVEAVVLAMPHQGESSAHGERCPSLPIVQIFKIVPKGRGVKPMFNNYTDFVMDNGKGFT